MRAKGTKSAVIAAALSVVLCVGMLAGTTFAWFTDTVTSAGNIIAAGSLDAGLFYAEGWNGEDTAWQDASEGAIFDSDAWAPGKTEIRYIKATNEGDIALTSFPKATRARSPRSSTYTSASSARAFPPPRILPPRSSL